MNKVCEILGTKYPIIQGAMAWIAEGDLASAVSNGGGLGIIAAGGRDADWLRAEIRRTREMTDKPFGVNIMLLAPNVDELMDVVCEEKVAVVTTGAGNPGKYIPKLKDIFARVTGQIYPEAQGCRHQGGPCSSQCNTGHQSCEGSS